MKQKRNSGHTANSRLQFFFPGEKFAQIVLFTEDRQLIKINRRHIKAAPDIIRPDSHDSINSAKEQSTSPGIPKTGTVTKLYHFLNHLQSHTNERHSVSYRN